MLYEVITILVDAGPVAYISFTRNIINGSVYKDEIIGSIEFLGSFFDIKSPLDGVIVEVNESITETPDLIVSDPYHGGWLFRMELSDPAELLDLMDEERYLQCFM